MPDPTSDLFMRAAERAIRYREDIGARRVAPLPEVVERLSALGGPLPDTSQPPEAAFALLDEIGSPATVATAGGRYFGFVTGGVAARRRRRELAGHRLGSECRPRTSCRPSPPRWSGSRSAGCWMSLACRPAVPAAPSSPARPWPTSPRWPPRATPCWRAPAGMSRRDGLFGAPPITVVVGAEVHVDAAQGAGLLGLGRKRVVTRAGGRPGAHARRRAASAQRPDDRLHPGRQREHRRLRPGGRDLRRGARARAPGCMWMARSASGRRPRPARATWWPASPPPTPGPPTRTSG